MSAEPMFQEHFKGDGSAKIIIDTDIGNDIDDALALSLAHSLADRGECELLAVTVNKGNRYAPAYVDVLNTFYGRGDIPVGWIGGEGATPEEGNFVKQVCECRDEGFSGYPRSFSGDRFSSALEVFRKTLAEQEDDSVVMVSIGFLTNLAELLASDPCEFSNLTGTELVSRKVRFLSIMAGNFSEEALSVPNEEFKEYNIYMDVESAKRVVAGFPVPSVFTGFELGDAVRFVAGGVLNDARWTSRHPVWDAYKLFQKMPYERPCWDLLSVLFAVRPDVECLAMSNPGEVAVLDNGCNTFRERPEGKHFFLVADKGQREIAEDEFSCLCR